MTRSINYSTVIMVICPIYSISKWTSIYSELSPSIGTLLSCFTFGKVDLVPTIQEYTILFRCLNIQADKAYSRAVNVPAFLKKLTSIIKISEQWVAA
ncbi:hypothetical protein Godav_019653 [Gossypium davidsonii]|uniref:Uncharacterized protein n=1 Tax=Gossypium davidsonii TaxID=34287 RepID=A0A7J8R0E7_GOSDV|nr:hypothetical protein [Gossypium davidsonii]